jgi:hypothetical protein
MRWTWTLLALGLSASACSIESTQPPPSCLEGKTAPIAAQSVPTAELIPCFDPLPAGWEVDNVRIDQAGTVIRFESDRAGGNAAIFHFTASCEVGEAVSAPSEVDGADRFEYIEEVDPAFRARRYYVFEGGCMWWEFDFDDDASAALSIELGDRLQAITRDAYNDALRESFIDEQL